MRNGDGSVIAPVSFIAAPVGGTDALLTSSSTLANNKNNTNTKKKSAKKMLRKKIGDLADKLGKHLEINQWAVSGPSLSYPSTILILTLSLRQF